MFKRTVFKILFLMVLMSLLSVNCLAGGPVELGDGNKISPDLAYITLDGRIIHPELYKEEGIIYADGKDLLATFGYRYTYDESSGTIKINNINLPAWRTAYINKDNENKLLLPLLETLSLLNIRYVYSNLYDSEVIAIRTDVQEVYNFQTNNYEIDKNKEYMEKPPAENQNKQQINYTDQQSSSPVYKGGPVSSVPDLAAKVNLLSAYELRGLLLFRWLTVTILRLLFARVL